MNRFLATFVVLFAAVAFLAEGALRVAIHADSCNTAALYPAYSTYISIQQQLTVGELIQATVLQDADFTLTNLQTNFDVVYLGCGGKDLDLDALSSDAASAIYNFVSGGGGLVLSATTPSGFTGVRSIIDPLLPFSTTSTGWGKTGGANSRPLLKINKEVSHYITTMNITIDYDPVLAYAFYMQENPKAGWTSLANVELYTAQCCLGFADCGDQYCTPYINQGILVSQIGQGRVAYINLAFCGYEMFGPFNLRYGVVNQLFLNMFYWTSKLCDENCNNHGACVGRNQCVCARGWEGATCSQAQCEPKCLHDGVCTKPNLCTCGSHFSGSICQNCAYPWAGENCEATRKVGNPSFEDADPLIWSLSGAQITGADSSVSPNNGTKMLVLTGDGQSAEQTVYLLTSDGSAPYITFYYRSTSLSSGAKLKFMVGSTVVWETSEAQSSWTRVRVSLDDFATESGASKTIKVVTENAGSSKFYVDNFDDGYPTCNPACANGYCTLDGCVCDEHHVGPACDQPICGDGYVELPETCDDGNTVDGDGCSHDCLVEEGWNCPTAGQPCVDICGDGRTMNTSDPDACDDGNTRNGDGCSRLCRVERGYSCTASPTERSICQVKCGDGIVFGSEKCDDGNNLDGDGCSSDCSKISPGWVCTFNYNQEGNLCAEMVCNNSVRTQGEECDDGICNGKSGCSDKCKIMPGFYLVNTGLYQKSILVTNCSDNITAGEEECDGGEGCTSDCHAEEGYICTVDSTTFVSTCVPNCGDGMVVGDEECDNGKQAGCSNCKVELGWHCVDPSHCTAVAENVCGDGDVHYPETCDIHGATDPGCINCQLTPGYSCTDTACTPVCGDGILTPEENCDCGDNDHASLCDSPDICVNCQSISAPDDIECENVVIDGVTYSKCRYICGNGVLQSARGEKCDDNNTDNDDGCSSSCQVETGWDCTKVEGEMSICTPICGDGIIVGDETCEKDAPAQFCIGCHALYGYVCEGSICHCVQGDGLICQEEECDEGPGVNTGGCVNGAISEGWECINETGPASVCIENVCGDGIRSFSEECDDGNNDNNDGCSSTCTLESEDLFECTNPEDRHQRTVCHPRSCGDGVITSDEECDDGNRQDGDGCSKNCKIERDQFWDCGVDNTGKSSCFRVKVCGDGYHNDIFEECDDGNNEDGDGCSSNCKIEARYYCEDVETGAGPEVYISSCKMAVCGDGRVERQGGEECDDGNTVSGDGCDSQCRIEAGYRCSSSTGGKSLCRSYCGDGIKSSAEECDDGNIVSGDGCGPTCKIEHGYSCFVNYSDPACEAGNCMSMCFATCGDGIVAPEEECDDGNVFQGDGCFNCKVEPPQPGTTMSWRCKGEPSECVLRNCTLPVPEIVNNSIRCSSAYSGVIDIIIDSNEDIITKIWRENEPEPVSYKSVLHYKNLYAGKYFVKVSINGFEECNHVKEVVFEDPNPFKGLSAAKKKDYFIPTACDKSDGKITWKPSGGTEPLRFYFAGRDVQSEGVWEKVSIREFQMGCPIVMDANNCTAEMDPGKGWPNETLCEEQEDVPFMYEGIIVVGAVFVVAIITAIVYSCWSSKHPVPRQGGRKK